MSELSFEQMLEDSVKTIRNGEIVQGTVIDVKDGRLEAHRKEVPATADQ